VIRRSDLMRISPQSLHSDLVVIGQRELQELKGYASPEKLLLSSGAPIPSYRAAGKSESIGNKITGRLERQREARRAVADALPFLSRLVP